MLSRCLVAALAALSVSACDHGDASAIEASEGQAAAATPSTATSATAPTSAGEAVLVEVWQSAHAGEQAPGIETLSAAFDPTFAKIANAPNDADNAFIASTLAFLRAVQTASPALCAEAPVARFDPAALAAVPAGALPALRTMLTDRLALVAAGAAHTAPPEELMSGSMQTFTGGLGDGKALEILPEVASAPAYDVDEACPATITAWEALDKAPQSPQLMRMLYSGEL